MKKITTTSVIAILLGAAVAGQSHAADEYQPANFGFSDQELLSKVDVDNAFHDSPSTKVLYCNAEIDKAGQAQRVDCFDQQQSADLEKDTQDALLELGFSAASVNGEKVPVRMSFRVVFSGSKGNVAAKLIPNVGSMQAQYGLDYIAPQERLDISDWYNTYNENSWLNGDEFFGDGQLARVTAHIGKTGKPTSVRTVEAERAYAKDAKLIEASLRRSRFIPGTVDGRPVAMGYMAVVNYGEAKEQVSYRTDK